MNSFKVQSAILLIAVIVSIASALPSLIVEDDEGVQYHLTPVLSRQRREGPEGFGQGFANKGVQSGHAGFVNPNGSGGSVGYAHANGYGHDLSVDGRVPVWSSKNRFGESTLNVGGGVSKHFGGWSGSHTTDKRIGLNFNHRF